MKRLALVDQEEAEIWAATYAAEFSRFQGARDSADQAISVANLAVLRLRENMRWQTRDGGSGVMTEQELRDSLLRTGR